MADRDPFRLDGRTAVVTGGLGLIGQAITRALDGAGARVTVIDLAEDRWRSLRGSLGETVAFAPGDLSEIEALPGLVADLDTRLGGISVWVNCAYPRTADWGAKPEDDTPEGWRRNVEMQMTGACLLADHIARRMAKRGGGSIINVASIYGVVAPDFSVYEDTDMTTPAAYSAIKGGLIAHSRYLASYYGRRGVRVNALCPGGVAADQPQGFVDAYARRTVLGRMAEAHEIGPPAVFLASDAAAYITGSALMVDGGWTAM